MKLQIGQTQADAQDWDALLQAQYRQPYYAALTAFLHEEYANAIVYPPEADIFKAFRQTNYDSVRVVVLGQDPYHGQGQANGLSFSVPQGVKAPPSLRNLLKEVSVDLQQPLGGTDLTRWAEQGVLLLNSVLTVRQGQANSHKDRGWEQFTNAAISLLNHRQTPIVFMLWGAYAQKKQALLTNPIHKCLLAPHPSPLSAHKGFFGCGHFAKANAFLSQNFLPTIQW